MRTVGGERDGSRYFVMSIYKAFRVLGAFSRSQPRLSLTELAARSQENKATVRRIALTLCDLGYLRQGSDRRYSLAPKVLDLGSRFLEGLSLPETAEPFVTELVGRTGETSNVAIREGSEALYVVRIAAAQRILAFNLHVGSRLPLHATSLGKALLMPAKTPEDLVEILGPAPWPGYTEMTRTTPEQLLADLAACRETGLALADGELEVGLRSIAAPVHDAAGAIVAAVNISTHSLRVPIERLLGPMREDLVGTAARISAALGYRGGLPSAAHGGRA